MFGTYLTGYDLHICTSSSSSICRTVLCSVVFNSIVTWDVNNALKIAKGLHNIIVCITKFSSNMKTTVSVYYRQHQILWHIIISAESAKGRDTVIEQSSNYSNRTFSRIIISWSYYAINICLNVPYSLNISRGEIFTDFMVLGFISENSTLEIFRPPYSLIHFGSVCKSTLLNLEIFTPQNI